jgi:zinc and cadmium transporter
MWFNIVVLIIAALLGGILAYRFKTKDIVSFDLPLIFAGAYLFGITVVHIIPELFTTTSSPVRAGIFVLAGFYLQQVLEFLTAGAEHGHLHQSQDGHSHAMGMSLSLLVGLSIHSFLEGTLLGHPTEVSSNNTLPLLLGITFHKVPAAFAMMTILLCKYHKSKWPLLFLLIFALASPLGILFSKTVELNNVAGEILFALVSGSFLHISTTIVFEGSPHHKFKIRSIAVSILGAVVAILVQALL